MYQKVFSKLDGKVSDWCTVNEPEVFSIMGYYMKMFPPGKGSLFKTIKVMKNMLRAHSQTYRALKEINPKSRIESLLEKNVTLFDPLRRWNLVHWITAGALNYIWNGAIISALTKGRMFGSKISGAKILLTFYRPKLLHPRFSKSLYSAKSGCSITKKRARNYNRIWLCNVCGRA